MADVEDERSWKGRDKKLVEDAQKDIAWYVWRAKCSKFTQRAISVVILACAIIAPVSVASGQNSGLLVLGLSDTAVSRMALIVTLTLAFFEGIARIFRFDQRYATYALTGEKLDKRLEEYKQSQIGTKVGSADWVKNISGFREDYFDLILKDISEYAEVVRGERAKS